MLLLLSLSLCVKEIDDVELGVIRRRRLTAAGSIKLSSIVGLSLGKSPTVIVDFPLNILLISGEEELLFFDFFAGDDSSSIISSFKLSFLSKTRNHLFFLLYIKFKLTH